MATTDFTHSQRQSSKGIIIIFGLNTYKFIRRFFVLFVAFGLSLSKKNTFSFLSTNTLLVIIVVILLLILIFAILKYLNFKFHLTNTEFHLSTGIFNKDSTIIPKSKIQNVYIKQNFIQQLIDVVSLNIETAGDDKSEIEINALDKPTALKLKRALFNKTEISNDPQNDQITNNVFFRVSLKRLLLEGVSQNHFKSFAILASFIFGLYYEFKDYLRELNIDQQLENVVQLKTSSMFNILLTNSVIVLVLVVLSMLFSIVKTVITNFNLEVLDNQKTIEINKGLLNKLSLSLTPSRIQNIVITTNRIKTYFGLYTLSVSQAMVNAKQRKNFKIIALDHLHVYQLLDKFLECYEQIENRSKPSYYFKRIMVLRMLLLVIIINTPVFLIFGNSMWWINLVLLIFCIAYVHFSYKKAYYSITENFVTIGSGFIETTTNILEIHKIQAIQIKQSVFQKRRQIASVIIMTASKAVKIPYITENDAKYINDILLYKLESQGKDWM
ncbi:MAG: PH domain-containing protein [Psychroserpens sp.]|uniref:PH domain-containing protein n=1 Tax=Psychroserpens sp. TaxID=2020870 RepID=UPI003C77B8A7